ncbi:putative Alkyldihydroxyacetonephosphate synthase [Cardiosporidium cionae]|uniref:Alkylglycerone-phosphate synthase n=1 Tax=Cardiosporidium cionae TaxID=476202 RepID=A0ABQ7J9P9_9APIC|nr:putative Alkyldihydroxyacetonephosphate synthase [Cardiosporidium cionae]|eukprot:KAF8820684.1 putative Alkyldihydroxyacetonephosphate synthase [Cardiosporidium cionae]
MEQRQECSNPNPVTEELHSCTENLLDRAKVHESSDLACKENKAVSISAEESIMRDAMKLTASNKLRICKWNGWGYGDSFLRKGKTPGKTVEMAGSRYGRINIPVDRMFNFMHSIGIDTTMVSTPQTTIEVPAIRNWNEEFIVDLKRRTNESCWIGTSPEERLFHGHGHTCQEIFSLRYGKLHSLPDAILYPGGHEDVKEIVSLARHYRILIIPYGGGTSVTMGLQCPMNCDRMVVTVSMSRINRVLWINKKNFTACIEAGAIGYYLEELLNVHGMTMGHQPDSYEFSTLGGWIATRASGMKKNTYGNIEDQVMDITLVTAEGTLEQDCQIPRMSAGPSIKELIIGSEGSLGIITKAIVKIKQLPQVQTTQFETQTMLETEAGRFGSIVFPNFEIGLAFMREVAKLEPLPTSIRLMDNTQFRFGLIFKHDNGNATMQYIIEGIKRIYLRFVAGFHLEDMSACTILFEGEKYSVAKQEKRLYALAKRYFGIPAGAKNGESGYNMVFLIAYIRDFVMNYHWIFESFETSVPWDRIKICCERVKRQISDDCKSYEISVKPIVMVRLTQVYPTGGVLYFYFGFFWKNIRNPVEVYACIEDSIRNVILDCGGSISHHHGVGKLRKKFLPKQVGEIGIEFLRGLKKNLDPTNIFGVGNLF